MCIQPKRSVWQISGGPTNRNYAEMFLRCAVALIGPGDAGPWSVDRDDKEFEGSYVRRFASEVQEGDVFLLRTGISTIRAVGLVAGEYLYLPQFDDVNGWDLQHARRVRWCPLPVDYNFESSVFGANPPRLSKIGRPDVIDYAERFIMSPPIDWQTSGLPALPEEEAALDAIPIYLQDIIANVNALHSVYWDPKGFGDRPTEDELVAHFVVPFLRKLGWSVEQIAVKWKYIDVAVFKRLPRSPDNCRFIIEAKRLGAGVEGALEQAKGYLESLGVSRNVVVTDGIRYRMYDALNGFIPIAYANLARLKKSSLALFANMKTP